MLPSQTDDRMLIAQASGLGSWQLMSYSCPINPISAALLRTGRILFLAGSGNNPDNINTPNGAAVLNLSNGTFIRPTTPLDSAGSPIDFFCCAHSFLSDGRLMCAGGTDQYDPFLGLPVALIFNPSNNQWVKESNQPEGARWYPTVITMGDGRIVVLSGIDEFGGIDTYPESYSSATGWSYFSGPALNWQYPTSSFPMYSHLFLMQDGRLFYSGAYFQNTGVSTHILTLPANYQGQITETPVSGLQNPDYGDQAASVLLPPAQDQKVMMIGGGNDYYGQTTNRVNIIDLNASSPAYTAAASLNFARMHHNAVLLPDRTVFVCNGSAVGEDANQGTRTSEIYNPATNTWTTAATAQKTRLYHAVAILLPDGRVLASGGNPARGTEERSIEIYSPPYMSQTRPTMSSAPTSATYGATITVGTSQPNSVKWVHLIRPMATTHGLDTEQRLVDLPITSRTSNSVKVTVTSNRNIAPPGYYMLFIVNNSNVPSQARWIRIS
ncbi:MAG: DUF1929 domain-containing protein [Scytonema sp. RU_4_4]|nr:DUF1929 domain-containing protein [Scytonema sp. RU_4_4]